MSQPRHITGHPIPDVCAPTRFLIWLSRAGESIIHPRRAFGSQFKRRWRNPVDFAKMTPAEFETYAVRTGLDADLSSHRRIARRARSRC